MTTEDFADRLSALVPFNQPGKSYNHDALLDLLRVTPTDALAEWLSLCAQMVTVNDPQFAAVAAAFGIDASDAKAQAALYYFADTNTHVSALARYNQAMSALIEKILSAHEGGQYVY